MEDATHDASDMEEALGKLIEDTWANDAGEDLAMVAQTAITTGDDKELKYSLSCQW